MSEMGHSHLCVLQRIGVIIDRCRAAAGNEVQKVLQVPRGQRVFFTVEAQNISKKTFLHIAILSIRIIFPRASLMQSTVKTEGNQTIPNNRSGRLINENTNSFISFSKIICNLVDVGVTNISSALLIRDSGIHIWRACFHFSTDLFCTEGQRTATAAQTLLLPACERPSLTPCVNEVFVYHFPDSLATCSSLQYHGRRKLAIEKNPNICTHFSMKPILLINHDSVFSKIVILSKK